MTGPEREDVRPDGSPKLTLAELAEQLACRIQAGERVEIEEYTRRYPGWAEAIRRLTPTIRAMAALGREWSSDHPTSTWS